MLANSLTLLGVNLVLDQLFKHILLVSYFTEFIWGSFGDRPVNRSRHYFLAMLIGLLRDHYITKK